MAVQKIFIRTNSRRKKTLSKARFQRSIAGDNLTHQLERSIERTFHTATLHLIFLTKPILTQQTKGRLPMMCSSMYVHRFNCSCGTSFMGRIQGAVPSCESGHVPAWLGKLVVKSVNSVISLLTVSENQIKIDEASCVSYQLSNNLLTGVRLRIQYIAEAI